MQDTLTVITFILGISGVVFGIYHYFKNPQIKLEKGESLLSLTVANIQKDITNLRDNHIHTLDMRVGQMNTEMNSLAMRVERLATIIEERIPRKT